MAKRKISLNNPWFVTLISTMIGIIAGLYITNYFENNRLYKAKEKALLQVESELKGNYQSLKQFHEQLTAKFKPVGIVFDTLDEESNLLIPKDSLESFRNKTAKVFSYESYTVVNDTMIRLHGDFDFSINATLMAKRLSDIVWNSYKQTDYLTITGFDCLTAVETFYVMQEEVNIKMMEWKDEFFTANYIKDKATANTFMIHWRTLLIKQSLLLDYYEYIEDVLSNCK